MKLKVVLFGMGVGLTIVWAMASAAFFDTSFETLRKLEARWWYLIALAVCIQILGHYLRTLRTKTVIDQIKPGKTLNQFSALATGYLFNTLLPLRAGELIRALLIAVELRISFLYTVTVIILERIIDLLLVGVLVLLIALFFNSQLALTLIFAALGVTIFAIAILVLLVLLVRENRFLLALIYRVSALFNDGLCNQLRFKAWSLIFGLQQFIKNGWLVKRYALLTLGSWLCYIFSLAVIAQPLFHGSPQQSFVTATVPYVAIGAPSGPAYATTYNNTLKDAVPAGTTPALRQRYASLSWFALTVPMSVLGLLGLLFFRGKITKRGKFASDEAFANKLLRHEDISQEFPAFLDSYFSGNSLARILHKLEIAGELSLVKFFKGGSDAITILVLSGKRLFVKKIIPLEFEDRLKAQYVWLQKHRKLKYLVKTLGEQRTDDYYAIDLEYDPNNIPFFEYIHHSSLAQSKAVLVDTWEHLYKHLYKSVKPAKLHARERSKFIDKHIYGCVEKAASTDPELRRVLEREQIVINGEAYDNVYQILDKIKQHKQAWADLATYQQAPAVHGDMAIDNILVSATTRKPLIIDPAPDGNIVSGPVFDMGKFSQSFYCGYEFLFRDDEPVHANKDGSINYRDHRSAKYTYLWNYLHKELAPQYLSEPEQRAMLFHAAALHLRVLKHRVYINPGNVLKFYAVGVKTLNEFLAQYE